MKTPLARFTFQCLAILGILFTILMISRCGGDSSSSVEATYSSLYTNFFKSCGQSECHPGEGNNVWNDYVQLDMSDSDKAYAALMTAPTYISKSSECSGVKLVVPEDADNSLLVAMFDSTRRAAFRDSHNDCGATIFTEHSVNATAEIKTAILDWIAAKATKN